MHGNTTTSLQSLALALFSALSLPEEQEIMQVEEMAQPRITEKNVYVTITVPSHWGLAYPHVYI